MRRRLNPFVTRTLLLLALAAGIPACGGGGGSGGGAAIPPAADYSGAYFTTLSEEPRFTLTLTQNGAAVTWSLVGAGWNMAGTGVVSGQTATLTMIVPFPMTVTVTFTGTTSFSGTFTATPGATPLTGTVTGSTTAPTTYDLAGLGIPQFVATDYIELPKIDQISYFRSSAGHDYADDFESCRSMKHYYILDPLVPPGTLVVTSPVAGTVVGYTDEGSGYKIGIESAANPGIIFIIFHVDLAVIPTPGDPVTAGQVLGTHTTSGTNSDIAVGVLTPTGWRLISYLETLTPALWADYVARGMTAPTDAIHSEAARDAVPLTCSGETFTAPSPDPLPAYFILN